MSRPAHGDIANGESMTTNAFDDLIRRAAPPVPDPGPSRRQLRTVLHARMWQVERRRQRRHRWGVATAAVLAFVMVYGVQPPQLGSDDLGFTVETSRAVTGNEVSRVVSPVRGKLGGAGDIRAAETLRELEIQRLIGEGVVTGLQGYAADGQAGVQWYLSVEREIDGRIIRDTEEPKEISIPFAPVPREIMVAFLRNHLDRFDTDLAAGRLPARDIGIVTADGIRFAVRAYTATFPDIGAFTSYVGTPVGDATR
ncbi:hypothetical protein KDM41_00890 [bacterium]|nr:hypothetical protein [bacterium]